MLSLVCLPVFIILVYVSVTGSTTNESDIESSNSSYFASSLSSALRTTTEISRFQYQKPPHLHQNLKEIIINRDSSRLLATLKTATKNIPFIVTTTVEGLKTDPGTFRTAKTTTMPIKDSSSRLSLSLLDNVIDLRPTTKTLATKTPTTLRQHPLTTTETRGEIFSPLTRIYDTLITTTSRSSSTSASAVAAATMPTEASVRTTATTESTQEALTTRYQGYLNITSQAGTHAYLPCNVKRLVNKPVSWIRLRDGHILTVDQTTFIADQRFQSIYRLNPERWSLQIKYVQSKDAGAYECQVSTEPKMSSKILLHVVVPKTEIIGEPIRHVKAGSSVTLRCVISGALEPPLYINWYFDTKQIIFTQKFGWRSEIDRGIVANQSDKQKTVASLIISAVRKKDSGNYTCSPSNSESITFALHVLNGEYSASAITSKASSILSSWMKNSSIVTSVKLLLIITKYLQNFVKI